MSKTIEKLAKQYAEDMCPVEEYRNGTIYFDEERENDMSIYIDDAKCVLDWLFNKPLASRLTEAEKERVMKTYKAMSDYGKKKDVMCADCANYVARVGLERIFGKEFFEEDKL